MSKISRVLTYLIIFLLFIPFSVNADSLNNIENVGLCGRIYGYFGYITYKHGYFNRVNGITEGEIIFPVYSSAVQGHYEEPYGVPLDFAVKGSNCAVVAKIKNKATVEKEVDFQEKPLEYFYIEMEVEEVIYGEVGQKIIKVYGQRMFFQSNGEYVNYSRLYNGDKYVIFLEKSTDYVSDSGAFYEFASHDRINLSNPKETFWHTGDRWDKNKVSDYFDPEDKDEIINYIKELNGKLEKHPKRFGKENEFINLSAEEQYEKATYNLKVIPKSYKWGRVETDSVNYTCDLVEVIKGEIIEKAEIIITAEKDSLKIGETYVIAAEKRENSENYFYMVSKTPINCDNEK